LWVALGWVEQVSAQAMWHRPSACAGCVRLLSRESDGAGLPCGVSHSWPPPILAALTCSERGCFVGTSRSNRPTPVVRCRRRKCFFPLPQFNNPAGSDNFHFTLHFNPRHSYFWAFSTLLPSSRRGPTNSAKPRRGIPMPYPSGAGATGSIVTISWSTYRDLHKLCNLLILLMY
jgi:hypothetical protein